MTTSAALCRGFRGSFARFITAYMLVFVILHVSFTVLELFLPLTVVTCSLRVSGCHRHVSKSAVELWLNFTEGCDVWLATGNYISAVIRIRMWGKNNFKRKFHRCWIGAIAPIFLITWEVVGKLVLNFWRFGISRWQQTFRVWRSSRSQSRSRNF